MLEIIGGVIDKRGLTGNGIASVENTATVTTDEKVTKTYTITFTNGDTYDFDVVSVNEEYASSVVEDAETAQTASESARDISISAKNDAVSAKNDALAYKTSAETSATTATNKATEASNYASSASSSATSASTSATLSEASRVASEEARDEAQGYAEDIEELTVSATTLPEGSEASVTKTGGGTTPYNLAFAIPKGDTGDTYTITEADYEEIADIVESQYTVELANLESEVESLDLTKANIDGYYDTLSVGLADNLIDRKGNGTPQEISYRTSCGDDSIADDGNGIIQSIFGKTVVWNQLVNIITATETRNGITFTWDSQSQTLTMNGSNSTLVDYSRAIPNLNTKLGHIYLAVPYIVSGTYTSGSCRISLGADYTPFVQSVSDSGKIVTASKNTTNAGINIVASADSTFDNLKIKYRIHDLTQMFGSGNEPTSVDDPRIKWIKDYALAHPEYNSGELISYNGSGIKTVGFNQWDEVWEVGSIDASGNPKVATSGIRSKNFISAFPNTEYFLKTPKTAIAYEYDEDKNFIRQILGGSTLSAYTWTTSSNCRYLKFRTASDYGTIYNHDINLNLSWSGYRNGEYEPYWSRTLALPISTYFPDGMKSAGSVRDEMTKDKATDKVLRVDLSSLDWTSGIIGGATCWTTTLQGVKLPDSNSHTPTDWLTSNNYTLVRYNGVGSTPHCIAISQTNLLVVRTDTTDEPSGYFHCERLTPIETTITPPLDLTYKVADFGTEESIAEGKSTPFNGIIKYSDDFTRGLVNMPKNYDTTASLDALATSLSTMLTSALDGTVTITRGAYDSTNKKYAWNCSFTPNA